MKYTAPREFLKVRARNAASEAVKRVGEAVRDVEITAREVKALLLAENRPSSGVRRGFACGTLFGVI